MRQFKQIGPRDVVAIIVVIGAFMLKFQGMDSVVSLILVSVVAYYFGLARPSTEAFEKVTEVGEKVINEEVGEKKDESVEDIIRRVCREEDVDPDLAVRVARAESGLRPDAVNVNNGGSKDRGVFQWNDHYHPEMTDECAFDVECATRAFCKAVKEGNLDWWDATRDKWEK